MKRLREKLKSQSGASILIALLFFALCAMVAASILVAASSNAGKIRNNREAQQRYLTLSSALNLICDELMQSSYTGQYAVVYTPDTNENGDILPTGKYEFVQEQGTFTSNLSGEALTNDVLPLGDELDALFSKKFSINKAVVPKIHELTVKAEGHKDVKVTVKLLDGYRILITAVLDENKMSAQLDITAVPEVDTNIKFEENNNWKDQNNGTYIKSEKSNEVKWELVLISKEVAAEGEVKGGS